jgi:DNA-binding CsgD family transcriptional regulator
MALAERDVDLALGVVAAAAAGQNGAPFSTELLDALLEAVPAECVDYVEWPFHKEPTFSISGGCEVWQGFDEIAEVMEVACATYPLRDIQLSTSVEPLRITDFVSAPAFRKTACYALIMRPFGIEHELKVWLPAPLGHARYFDFVREPGKDFSARDVEVLRLVRPHLARLRARWERTPRPAQLTERERDVLELVAQGLTNGEVARRLFISSTTVRTHLEHIYEKLGVRTRAGAVAAAFRAVS